MDWTWYLFGFQGRINRAKDWLGGLVMLGWALFVAWIIFLPLHLVADGEPIPASLDFSTGTIFAIFDPATYHLPSRADVIPIIANVIGMPVIMWIYVATSIKRLHDRDRSGWWMLPFVVVPVLYGHFADRLPYSIRDAARLDGGRPLHLGLDRNGLPEGHRVDQPVRRQPARQAAQPAPRRSPARLSPLRLGSTQRA